MICPYCGREFGVESSKAGGRKRWKGVEKQERSRILSAAGKATWANLTPKERSIEMKRRAAKRKRNRVRAIGGKP